MRHLARVGLEVFWFFLIAATLYPLLGEASFILAAACLITLRCVSLREAPPPAQPAQAAGDMQLQHDAQRDVILVLCETLPPEDAVALRGFLAGGDAAGDAYGGLLALDALWGARAGGAPPPLPDAAIDSLATRAAAPADGDCAICLEPNAHGIALLPCEHAFHPRCIRPWLQQAGVCPVCRFKFS